MFFCEFYKIAKKTVFTEHLWATTSANHVTLCSTYLLNDKNYNTYFLTTCFFYTLCLVLRIYFCRFADFKLQRDKVQSRKFSFVVMENFDTEFIGSLLYEENTIEEVSLILQDMYNKRDLSIRYLKSYSAKHGISKRILEKTLDNLVAEAVEEALEAGIISCIRCNLSPHCYF